MHACRSALGWLRRGFLYPAGRLTAHCPQLPQAKRRRDMFCRKLAPDYAGEGALGSVVGVLLLSTSVEMRVLGVELLTDFIRLQVGWRGVGVCGRWGRASRRGCEEGGRAGSSRAHTEWRRGAARAQ